MYKKSKYFQIINPTGKCINRIWDAFVDDTALYLSLSQTKNENKITPEYIAQKLEKTT